MANYLQDHVNAQLQDNGSKSVGPRTRGGNSSGDSVAWSSWRTTDLRNHIPTLSG